MFKFENDIQVYLIIHRKTASGTWQRVKENSKIFPDKEYRMKFKFHNTNATINKDMYYMFAMDVTHPQFRFYNNAFYAGRALKTGQIFIHKLFFTHDRCDYYFFFKPITKTTLVNLEILRPIITIHYFKVKHSHKKKIVAKAYD